MAWFLATRAPEVPGLGSSLTEGRFLGDSGIA